MSSPERRKQPAHDEELHAIVEELLGPRFPGRRIVRVERRPFAYRTSFALEELDVVWNGGAELALLFKDVGRNTLAEDAARAKPFLVYDAEREIAMYRSVLASNALGTADCYGAIADANTGRYWLFLERVAGRELYQVGDIGVWQQAARWLAAFHRRFAVQAAIEQALWARLLIRNREYYRSWMERALHFADQRPGTSADDRRALRQLAPSHAAAAERLAALPSALIHGEFYASNVLVQDTHSGLRVCPVDWEMAGWGPGLLDLAALVAGKWSDEQRTAIALAYWQALGDENARDERSFWKDLNDCRLHLAVQWLGWSGDWAPPPEHRQDWLAEALRLAEETR